MVYDPVPKDAVGTVTAKVPSAGLMAALWLTPLTVTVTLPLGMSEPAAMAPVICVLEVPSMMVGGATRLKIGVRGRC